MGGVLCENCHQKPKYNDGQKTHRYCSKSCAAKAGTNTCDYCHSRPKHPGHQYCGKTCAGLASGRQGSGPVNQPGICSAPGCQKPVHKNSDGVTSAYCSKSHRELGDTLCLMCRQKPRHDEKTLFCGVACRDQAEQSAPRLLEVPVGHDTFKDIAYQFQSSWRHPTSCPPVRRVYKIIASRASLTAYNSYKADIQRLRHLTDGNENRRWHGTKRECTLGDNGRTQFCGSATCPLCNVIQTSFKLSKFGSHHSWGRFGKGIYTSSTSSKSNDYSKNLSTSPMKAIILNKVVVGKGFEATFDHPTLTAAPQGHDSVLAEPAPWFLGGTLNYDELIVYKDEAIRPSYLVIYESS